MNELTKASLPQLVEVVGDEPRACSTVIAEGCQVDHVAVMSLIKKYQAKLERRGIIEFQIRKMENAGRGRPQKVAWLNEAQATFLITLMRNTEPVVEFKDRLTEAFFRMREELQRRTADVSVQGLAALIREKPAMLAQVAAELAYENRELREEVGRLAPKASKYERFMNAEGLFNLQNAGRALGAKPNKFVEWLKTAGYLFYQNKTLVPKHRYRERGIFRVVNKSAGGRSFSQTYVTPKGLDYLADRVPEDILIEPYQPRLPLPHERKVDRAPSVS